MSPRRGGLLGMSLRVMDARARWTWARSGAAAWVRPRRLRATRWYVAASGYGGGRTVAGRRTGGADAAVVRGGSSTTALTARWVAPWLVGPQGSGGSGVANEASVDVIA